MARERSDGCLPPDRGLDAAGFVRREGDPSLVQPELAGVVQDYVTAVRTSFGDRGLDGVYLYGSIPRGTARPGSSDLDGQVLLAREPTDDDRALLGRVTAALAARHPEVCAVEVLLHSRARMTDPALRFDEGFHIRVLCTPVWGSDAGQDVAPHRPDLALARQVQGAWRTALRRLRAAEDRLTTQGATPDVHEVAAHRRRVGRRLARLAFTWVMPRWGGWTSDPAVIVDVVGQLEPSWRSWVAQAAGLGWGDLGPVLETRGGAGDDRASAQEQRAGVSAGLLDGFAEALWRRGDDLGA